MATEKHPLKHASFSVCLLATRLTPVVPACLSFFRWFRGPTLEEEGAEARGPRRRSALLGPGSYCEDAVCPGGPHCGGEGLQVGLCYWRRRCKPGKPLIVAGDGPTSQITNKDDDVRAMNYYYYCGFFFCHDPSYMTVLVVIQQSA